MIPLHQHQVEIEHNLAAWQRKPLLQKIYADFYKRILPLVSLNIPGQVVELGSGIGNLKAHLPNALCTDLFPNPWIDLVCDAYKMPFAAGTVSHLILFDVFHHLERPGAFFKEAGRVLVPDGRVIIFEPYISLCSFPVYGMLHHEPVTWRTPISSDDNPPAEQTYYAAQGNATRLFFSRSPLPPVPGWKVLHAEAFSAFSYLFSGGFSKPAFYPESWLEGLCRMDARLSRWPRLFGARCVVELTVARG